MKRFNDEWPITVAAIEKDKAEAYQRGLADGAKAAEAKLASLRKEIIELERQFARDAKEIECEARAKFYYEGRAAND